MNRIEIKQTDTINQKEFINLYKEAGWWKDEYYKDTLFIDGIPKNSSVFIGAFDNHRLIGMGRAVSDNISDAYIQDVVVLSSYRGQDIGNKIIREIIRQLKKKGVDWIGLIAEPDTDIFYKKIGFKQMKDHVPMMLGD